jgi:hypothetical protein
MGDVFPLVSYCCREKRANPTNIIFPLFRHDDANALVIVPKKKRKEVRNKNSVARHLGSGN